MTKPSICGCGGGGGGERQQRGSCARARKLAEKARDSPEPEKALFVRWGPLQNRKLTQKLTCDLLGPHLKFESAVVSVS